MNNYTQEDITKLYGEIIELEKEIKSNESLLDNYTYDNMPILFKDLKLDTQYIIKGNDIYIESKELNFENDDELTSLEKVKKVPVSYKGLRKYEFPTKEFISMSNGKYIFNKKVLSEDKYKREVQTVIDTLDEYKKTLESKKKTLNTYGFKCKRKGCTYHPKNKETYESSQEIGLYDDIIPVTWVCPIDRNEKVEGSESPKDLEYYISDEVSMVDDFLELFSKEELDRISKDTKPIEKVKRTYRKKVPIEDKSLDLFEI